MSTAVTPILLFTNLQINVDKRLFTYLYRIKTDPKYPIVDLEYIKVKAEHLVLENDQFQAILKEMDSEQLDQMVFSLSETIAPQISCTSCGNCCKSLMVNIDEQEALNLSQHLGLTTQQFEDNYISKGESGRMVINSIPCHFLEGNRCSVYEYRFAGCKEFPAFHVPNFNKRLFTTYMHYDKCPIIFNVLETLKITLGFEMEKK